MKIDLLDTFSPQDNAWHHLLALETQVQSTQASLALHTKKLTNLCQSMETIAHSLQTLLECLPLPSPTSETLPTPSKMSSPACFNATMMAHSKIPHPALSNAYDGDHKTGEQFLQSCITYIQLSGRAFASDALKIGWVLFYMKLGHALTYALQVFLRNGGVRSFASWDEFECEF
ncbi:hypothetical protein C0989_001634 [Termitomyces sp. Mn162]|nr:hypothetical protein C0989_001634 [Termitomyces sp. Mn162]